MISGHAAFAHFGRKKKPIAAGLAVFRLAGCPGAVLTVDETTNFAPHLLPLSKTSIRIKVGHSATPKVNTGSGKPFRPIRRLLPILRYAQETKHCALPYDNGRICGRRGQRTISPILCCGMTSPARIVLWAAQTGNLPLLPTGRKNTSIPLQNRLALFTKRKKDFFSPTNQPTKRNYNQTQQPSNTRQLGSRLFSEFVRQ